MAESKVIKLIDRENNNQHWTVEDMLRSCLENPELLEDFPKAVIIFLDDSDGYSMHFDSAKMFRPEIVTVLEVAKLAFLRTLSDGEEF